VRFPQGRYRQQAEELIRLSASLGDREKVIAEYWADGPMTVLPPGHFNLFAQYVSLRDGHTLDRDVVMFFVLTNAVFDAGIAAWDAKNHYDYVRPVTAIRHLKRGRKIRAWAGPGLGVRTIAGETWRPYQPGWFPTPPFAECVSGHSAFSAARAEILKRFTGSDRFGASVTITRGDLGVEPGVPASPVTLTWPTFSDAADEAPASPAASAASTSKTATSRAPSGTRRGGGRVGDGARVRERDRLDGAGGPPASAGRRRRRVSLSRPGIRLAIPGSAPRSTKVRDLAGGTALPSRDGAGHGSRTSPVGPRSGAAG
jgi:hypothetical protein